MERGSLLVLGGSRFVGRAVVDRALADGWAVTTFTLEQAHDQPGVERLRGDRNRPGCLAAIRGRRWDAVIDTWQGSPAATREAVSLLGSHCGHYGYVSSLLAYAWPPPRPLSEAAPLRPATRASGDYAARKAASERVVAEEIGERALIARAGLILGPHEHPGRLPWWLLRLQRGGDVLAPGSPRRPLQLVDARDLAAWLLDCASRGLGGAYNVASPRGEMTLGELLAACAEASGGEARLHWVGDARLQATGLQPWTELPLWVPSESGDGAIFDVDVSAALAAGARFRPVGQTVADTWAWLCALDPTARAAFREDRRRLTAAEESRILAAT